MIELPFKLLIQESTGRGTSAERWYLCSDAAGEDVWILHEPHLRAVGSTDTTLRIELCGADWRLLDAAEDAVADRVSINHPDYARILPILDRISHEAALAYAEADHVETPEQTAEIERFHRATRVLLSVINRAKRTSVLLALPARIKQMNRAELESELRRLRDTAPDDYRAVYQQLQRPEPRPRDDVLRVALHDLETLIHDS